MQGHSEGKVSAMGRVKASLSELKVWFKFAVSLGEGLLQGIDKGGCSFVSPPAFPPEWSQSVSHRVSSLQKVA